MVVPVNRRNVRGERARAQTRCRAVLGDGRPEFRDIISNEPANGTVKIRTFLFTDVSFSKLSGTPALNKRRAKVESIRSKVVARFSHKFVMIRSLRRDFNLVMY